MAVDSWMRKLRSAVTTKSRVGIFAFEMASIMSKVLHLWRSLSNKRLQHLRHHLTSLPGLRKLVSGDVSFLLDLAMAEFTESLRLVAVSVFVLATRCSDRRLRRFTPTFMEFADSGRDLNGWVLSCKEMDAMAERMDLHITSTAALHREMERLWKMEKVIGKPAGSEDRHNLFRQQQLVKRLKASSLWGRSFEDILNLLARSIFTVLARINFARLGAASYPPPPLLRRHSCSAAVHPAADMQPESLPRGKELGFFETNAAALRPPSHTLGGAALALHYANIILLVEKMIRAPSLIPSGARHGLYGMLTASLRTLLRARLRGVRGNIAAGDDDLADKWKTAMARIISWLLPLAHNTVRWQAERSLEQQWGSAAPRSDVLLLQTLWFAGTEKTEAAITELLVGLNYVWRFETEIKMVEAGSISAQDSQQLG